jgi:hypothetical protein
LVHATYTAALDFMYAIPGRFRESANGIILDAVFGVWFLAIALVLLFIAGARKAGGIWSTPQSFSSGKNQYYHATQPVMAQPPQHYGYA